jgi:pseudoazurin
MRSQIKSTAIVLAALALMGGSALATDYTVEMKNKGADGAMVFEPALVEIAVGDTVTFIATDKTHNAETIKGLLPEGAEPFKGKMSKDVTVTFDVPGVYAIKCLPHYAMGMVAIVEVGDDRSNLASIESAKYPKVVSKRFAPIFEALNGQ